MISQTGGTERMPQKHRLKDKSLTAADSLNDLEVSRSKEVSARGEAPPLSSLHPSGNEN